MPVVAVVVVAVVVVAVVVVAIGRRPRWHDKIWRMSVFGYGSVSKTVELAELIVISTSVEASSAAVLTRKADVQKGYRREP